MTNTPPTSALLDLASRHYRGAGAREQAIRDELDLSATRFWQLVVALVTDPPADVALEHGPTINRLRRRLAVGVDRRVPRRHTA